jgi:hypothetical protein
VTRARLVALLLAAKNETQKNTDNKVTTSNTIFTKGAENKVHFETVLFYSKTRRIQTIQTM